MTSSLPLAASPGLSFGEPAALGVLALGLAVAIGIGARASEHGRPWSSGLVYAALGLIGAAGVAIIGVDWLRADEDVAVVEHVAEICVVVTLYATGLQIDRPLSWREWRTVGLLLGVLLPLTIAAVAGLGMALLGLSLGAAIVLGAALAPTDPVLAGDVGVGGPNSEEEPEANFSLTAEASLNDGLAFPFVLLGLSVVAEGAGGLGSWFLLDVLYKVAGGVLVGVLGGWLAARYVLPRRREQRIGADLDAWLAVAVALTVYGAAQLVSTYGFLAAVCAGLAFRRYERDHENHEELHAGAERIVRLLELGTIVLILSMVTWAGLTSPGWAGLLVCLLLVFVIRPVLGLVILRPRWLATPQERGFVAFYGVRGVGSLYYVGAAIGAGVLPADEGATILWTAILCVLVSVVVHGVTANFGLRTLEAAPRHREERAGAVVEARAEA